MEVTIKIEKKVNIKTLLVDAGVRYWEDATVNDTEDTDGTLIPCREGDRWKPIIDIDSGIITNWTKGIVAKIHYKICDDGIYTILDTDGSEVKKKDGYVIGSLAIEDSGYGDYIIINVDADGKINDWDFDSSDFEEED